jgi:3-hydroxybutyryl-CoA dehydrogenase
MVTEIKTVGVVGAGTMGGAIAHVAALAGFNVILRDIDMKYVDGGVKRMSDFMDKSIAKGKMTPDVKEATLKRVKKTTEMKDLKNADIVIEAVLENIELKVSVFKELNGICGPDTIFGTNTSSISITEIAAGCGRPDKFCGIHFFNPVQLMKLVEVTSGLNTSQETIDSAKAFAAKLGKTAVHVKKDSPGFIVNRLLVPYLNEAVRLLEEGVASVEDIDTAIKLGLNYPMGPFEMQDMGGVDLSVTVLDYFTKEFGDPSYAPRYLLRQMVRANKKGRKTGEGFYKY